MGKPDRTCALFVRLTPAERERVRQARKKAGFHTDSEWLREVVKKASQSA